MSSSEILAQNRKSWNEMADSWFGTTALPTYGCYCPKEDELQMLSNIAGKKVLDIGCGSGHSLKWCGEHGASELWGVDLSDRQIENAGKHLRESNYAARLFCSPMEQNPGLPQDYFDIVYSIYAIGWTVDLEATFRLVSSYLKQGGIFIFSWDHPLMHCVEAIENRLVVSGSYFSSEPFSPTLRGQPVTMFRRRFSDYINALAFAGFMVERIVEETDKETMTKDHNFTNEYYAPSKAKQMPLSIVIRARKLK